MTLSEAIETIEKLREDITDKIFLGEKPYPPDEYFLAVEKVFPYLKCLNCMALQATKDNGRAFVPHCDADKFLSPELNADELPFC